MESNIQIFNNPQFGNVRIAKNEHGEPIFCLPDLCNVLGLTNTSVVKARLDDGLSLTYPIADSLGRMQETTFVTEPGFYDVVIRSDSPKAKPFRTWIISEVLPTIRKHGAYMTPQTLENVISDPDFGIKLLTSLKEERQMRIEAEAKTYQQEEIIEHKNEEIQKLLPDAQYARDTLKSISTLTTTQLAKELGMSAVTLNRKLHDLGIQHKVNEQWVLYAKYEDKGYTKTHTYTEIINGESRTWHSTVWTEAGRMFIHELIKKGLPCKQTSTLNNN